MNLSYTKRIVENNLKNSKSINEYLIAFRLITAAIYDYLKSLEFDELEESIKNSNGEEKDILTKIYNRNRFAINQLLGAARDLAKAYNVNIEYFELDDF